MDWVALNSNSCLAHICAHLIPIDIMRLRMVCHALVNSATSTAIIHGIKRIAESHMGSPEWIFANGCAMVGDMLLGCILGKVWISYVEVLETANKFRLWDKCEFTSTLLNYLKRYDYECTSHAIVGNGEQFRFQESYLVGNGYPVNSCDVGEENQAVFILMDPLPFRRNVFDGKRLHICDKESLLSMKCKVSCLRPEYYFVDVVGQPAVAYPVADGVRKYRTYGFDIKTV